MIDAHEHLSDLALSRLLAEESAGLEQARAHLEACDRCRASLRALEAERAEWRSRVDAAAFTRSVLHRAAADGAPSSDAKVRYPPFFGRFGPKAAVAAIGLAAAVILAVVLLPPGPTPDTVGLKGGAAVTLLVVKGQASRPLAAGEALRGGDRVGISVGCPEGCQVYLHDASRDHAPLVDRPFTAPAGEPQALDFTATLDDATDDERLEVLLCREAVAAGERRAALAEGRAPPGCRLEPLRIPRVGASVE